LGTTTREQPSQVRPKVDVWSRQPTADTKVGEPHNGNPARWRHVGTPGPDGTGAYAQRWGALKCQSLNPLVAEQKLDAKREVIGIASERIHTLAVVNEQLDATNKGPLHDTWQPGHTARSRERLDDMLDVELVPVDNSSDRIQQNRAGEVGMEEG
jgi:hypothetical protein